MKRKIVFALLLLTMVWMAKSAFAVFNPMTGRWLTPDPIGEQGGINLYQFVKNNPVNHVDPFGLQLDLLLQPPPLDILAQRPTPPAPAQPDPRLLA